jgi:TPR repeat protein
MYEIGHRVPQDDVQAATWFRKAADQGNASAQYNLGMLYLQGQGVLQDYAQAVVWFRKAADQQHAKAQFALGLMYQHGQEGVPQNSTQAYVWLVLSASHAVEDQIREQAVMK